MAPNKSSAAYKPIREQRDRCLPAVALRPLQPPPQPPQARCRAWALCVTAATAAAALVFATSSGSNGMAAINGLIAGKDAENFDCYANLDLWQQQWSHKQKEWCCDNRGQGCPEQKVCGRSEDTAGPNLFCVAVISPQERKLMQEQLRRCVHIFACDEWRVVSDTSLWLSEDLKVRAMPFDGPHLSKVSGDSYNAEQFRGLWRLIHSEGQYTKSDWVVKTDLDAVFFADRLRMNLVKSKFVSSDSLVFANCHDSATVSPHFGGPFMFGAIELFSRVAADIFFNVTRHNTPHCNADETFEEHYIQKCMESLGISLNQDLSLNLLHDDFVKCNGATEAVPCSDDDAVAFHHYSGIKEWFDCYDTATGSKDVLIT